MTRRRAQRLTVRVMGLPTSVLACAYAASWVALLALAILWRDGIVGRGARHTQKRAHIHASAPERHRLSVNPFYVAPDTSAVAPRGSAVR